MNLVLEVAGRTDVGRVRPHNEDSFGYDTGLGIFVVCDGMGGHAAGEVASQIAVDTIIEYFRDTDRPDNTEDSLGDVPLGPRMLAEAVKKANDSILHYANTHTAAVGMGTTLVAARFAEDRFSIAHLGDSRIYLFREGELLQLTEDHSLVMEQVRRGMLTLEEAQQSSAQNIITRALGTEETTLPDLGDFPAQVGDTLLMTTDGILRHVSNTEIRAVLQQLPSLQAACDTLIEAANEAGGLDNSTCLLVRVLGKVKLEEEEKRDAASSEDEAVEDDEDETTQIVIDHETPPAGVPQPKNLGDRS